jgi:hypothetical protein
MISASFTYDGGHFSYRYCAERVSTQRSADRVYLNYDTEIYLMDMEKQAKNTHLDALHVRNHAPFAAFACKRSLANMVKKQVYTGHWDRSIPHVGFFATRDIQPGEELSYMRLDEGAAKKNEGRICACGHPECKGRL